MHDTPQGPAGTSLPEEIFQLNMAYLSLAKRLIAEDRQQAEIVLGVTEPLSSWLHGASDRAIATLAVSRVTIFALRLPGKAADRVLAACADALWLGPAHVSLAALGVPRGRSR